MFVLAESRATSTNQSSEFLTEFGAFGSAFGVGCATGGGPVDDAAGTVGLLGGAAHARTGRSVAVPRAARRPPAAHRQRGT